MDARKKCKKLIKKIKRLELRIAAAEQDAKHCAGCENYKPRTVEWRCWPSFSLLGMARQKEEEPNER